MPTHLAAWFQSTFGLSLAELNQVQDDILTQPNGQRFQVPTDYLSIKGLAALGNGITRAQMKAPSLDVRREKLEVLPRVQGSAKFSLGFPEFMVPTKDVDLEATETITMIQSDGAGVAFSHYGLIWLGPKGPLPPMPEGDVRRVRAVASTTLTAQKWTSVTMTPDADLEPGQYSLVGLIPISATCVAGRVIITGQNYRPGFIGFAGTEAAAADFDPRALKNPLYGYPMGSFAHTNIPQVQFLADAADTSETVFFDVIRIGDVGTSSSIAPA